MFIALHGKGCILPSNSSLLTGKLKPTPVGRRLGFKQRTPPLCPTHQATDSAPPYPGNAILPLATMSTIKYLPLAKPIVVPAVKVLASTSIQDNASQDVHHTPSSSSTLPTTTSSSSSLSTTLSTLYTLQIIAVVLETL